MQSDMLSALMTAKAAKGAGASLKKGGGSAEDAFGALMKDIENRRTDQIALGEHGKSTRKVKGDTEAEAAAKPETGDVTDKQALTDRGVERDAVRLLPGEGKGEPVQARGAAQALEKVRDRSDKPRDDAKTDADLPPPDSIGTDIADAEEADASLRPGSKQKPVSLLIELANPTGLKADQGADVLPGQLSAMVRNIARPSGEATDPDPGPTDVLPDTAEGEALEADPISSHAGQLLKLLGQALPGKGEQSDIDAKDQAEGSDPVAGDAGPDLLSAADAAVMAAPEGVPPKPSDHTVAALNPSSSGQAQDAALLPAVLAEGSDGDIVLPDAEDPRDIRFEPVFVTDVRRYVGLAGDSNGLGLARAIGEDLKPSTVQSGLLDGIAGNVTTTVHTLKLQMNPLDLGHMTASLRLKGDELEVTVSVDTMEAFATLQADRDGLIKSLREQGFSIEQVTIQLQPAASGGDMSSSSQGQNSQQSQTGGQAGRDASGQDGQSRAGERGQDGRRQEGFRHGGSDRENAGDVRPVRTGSDAAGRGVYL